MHKLQNIIRQWLPLALVIVVMGGMVYIVAQQAYRMNANDPQIQMAEDGAAALAQETAPDVVAPPAKIDVASSLAPFVMVFDDAGNVLGSSGLLNGQIPRSRQACWTSPARTAKTASPGRPRLACALLPWW